MTDRICAVLSEQGGHVALVSDQRRADLVIVAGNGTKLVEAVSDAMTHGRLVVAAGSADADGMVVHRVSGWSTATGEPLGDVIAEAARSVGSGAAPIRRAAMATARARSSPDAILHDLACALCEVIVLEAVADGVLERTAVAGADLDRKPDQA
jgi:Ni,Fe-hydrogenase III small subunit